MMNLKKCIKTIFRAEDMVLTTKENFEKFQVLPEIVRGLNNMGLTKVSRLQEKILPELLNSPRNKVIVSKPGEGKTIALGICALNNIQVNMNKPQVLIICAHYEAVFQMEHTLKSIGCFMAVTFDTVVSTFEAQPITSHVVIGSPKEVVGMIKERLLNMNDIRLIIFEDVDVTMTTQLVKNYILREYKQRLVLSCLHPTLHLAIEHSPVKDNQDIISHNDPMVIMEAFIKCNHAQKILAVITTYNELQKFGGKAIVFCRVHETVDVLHNVLKFKGLSVDKTCNKFLLSDRISTFESFLNGHCKMLITTNLLARAIDVPNLCVAINYDMPCYPGNSLDETMYLNRIGRATRFGRQCMAINLVAPDEHKSLEKFNFIRELDIGWKSKPFPFSRSNRKLTL